MDALHVSGERTYVTARSAARASHTRATALGRVTSVCAATANTPTHSHLLRHSAGTGSPSSPACLTHHTRHHMHDNHAMPGAFKRGRQRSLIACQHLDWATHTCIQRLHTPQRKHRRGADTATRRNLPAPPDSGRLQANPHTQTRFPTHRHATASARPTGTQQPSAYAPCPPPSRARPHTHVHRHACPPQAHGSVCA